MFCESKEVEDEEHFMLDCHAYAQEREEMWTEYETVMHTSRENLGREAQLATLIGDTHQPEEEEDKDSQRTKKYINLTKTVMKYITTAMRKRKRKEQEASVKSTRVDAPHFACCSEEA